MIWGNGCMPDDFIDVIHHVFIAEALGPRLQALTLRHRPALASWVSLCNVTHFRRLQVSTGYQVHTDSLSVATGWSLCPIGFNFAFFLLKSLQCYPIQALVCCWPLWLALLLYTVVLIAQTSSKYSFIIQCLFFSDPLCLFSISSHTQKSFSGACLLVLLICFYDFPLITLPLWPGVELNA